jgi:uncharacterized RDD family membrane protein YckC
MREGPNPFAPPKAEWEKSEAPLTVGDDYMDASQGARLANFLLDMAIRFGAVFLGALTLKEASAFVTLAITFGYYIFFEAIFSRTPAKWLTRTRVVTFDGRKPSFLQIVGRSFARYVPFEPFSFLGSARGWHDRWSNTRVVRDQPVEGTVFPKD